MRRTVCAGVVAALSTLSLAAQSSPARHTTTRTVVDPLELSGAPKKLVVLTPTKRAFFQTSAWRQLQSKDPNVLASVARELTTFIQQDPADTDLYFLRATVSCQSGSGNKEAMLNDVATAIKLWKPND